MTGKFFFDRTVFCFVGISISIAGGFCISMYRLWHTRNFGMIMNHEDIWAWPVYKRRPYQRLSPHNTR